MQEFRFWQFRSIKSQKRRRCSQNSNKWMKTWLYFPISWLVVCSLWHIHPCRLFNAKSCLCIFIKYLWFVNELFEGKIFYTRQSSFVCTQLNGSKYCSLILIVLTVKWVLLIKHFYFAWQVLPIQIKVDLGLMPMKFIGVEPHHQLQFSVIYRTLVKVVVFSPLCRGSVGVF